MILHSKLIKKNKNKILNKKNNRVINNRIKINNKTNN